MYNLLLSTALAFTRDDIDTIEQGVGTSRIRDISSFLDGTTGNRYFGLVDLMLFIAGALFAVYLVWGGIKFMMSAGEPKAVAEAKQTITNALVGLVITMFAFLIVQAIAYILGLPTVIYIFNT